VVTALLLAGAVEAETPDLEAMLQEGIVRFNLGRFSESVKSMQAVTKSTNPRLRAQAYLYLGLTQSVLSDHARGAKYFREALNLDPTLNLDPNQTKETTLQLFASVRETMTGQVQISADRGGVLVAIDGQPSVPLPHRGSLMIGKHRLVFRDPSGVWGSEQEVVVQLNRSHEIKAELTLIGAMLRVEATPSGAQISVAGLAKGPAPVTL
jgi:tetratricopeptide (TPR) repeat protein